MSVGLKYLSAIIANGAGSAVLQLDPSLLIDNNEEAAFEFVKDYYRNYREVPTPRLVQENTRVRLPTAEGTLEFHHDNLQERYDFQVLRDHWDQHRQLIANGRPKPLVDLMEGTLRHLRSRHRKGQTLIDAHQGMGLVIDRLRDAIRQGGISGIPTQWPTFNEQSGGYQPADLITWVGRSAMGKTAMLLSQAEAAYDAGYSVLVVTSEMGSEQIARRWMTMRFGLNPRNLKMGTVSTYLLRRMEAMQAELLGRERFRILSLGTGAQLSAVEAAISETAPDIVFIDGIYLFYPSKNSSYMKQTERVTAVFDQLKQQCIDTNLPHVVTTQFNRQAGKGGKDGSLETIGLSDAIGWHSSIVVAVKTGPTEDPRQSRELEFLKGREGEEGKFAINFKFRPVDFSEMTREQLDAIQPRQMLNHDPDWT